MVRHVEVETEWDDEGWDENRGDEEWDEDGHPTMPCPYCQQEIFEDSPRCPQCGQYISEEDAPAARRPWWIIIGVLLCLCAIWIWITR
jgi:hypothetical protein